MMQTLIGAMSTLFMSYLFVTGGWHKLADFAYFERVIADYQVLPKSWSPWIARGLPLLELGAGLALLIPALHLSALATVTVLLCVYTAAICVNVARGRRELDCGCAGPGQQQKINGWLITRNLLLLSLAILSTLAQREWQLGWLGLCIALPGSALLALFYHIFNQLVANNTLLQGITRHG